MGFRIDEEHEVTGIDLVVHAETAYDLHSHRRRPRRPAPDAAASLGRPPRGGRR